MSHPKDDLTEDDRLFLEFMDGEGPALETNPEPVKGVPPAPGASGTDNARPPTARRPTEDDKIWLEYLDQMEGRTDFPSDTDDSEGDEDSVRARRPADPSKLPSVDLHGMTRDKALQHLSRALDRHCVAGNEYVIIITGRGLHSSERAVLKESVPDWLKGSLRRYVVHFERAGRGAGGSGALLVRLRVIRKR